MQPSKFCACLVGVQRAGVCLSSHLVEECAHACLWRDIKEVHGPWLEVGVDPYS